MNTRPFQLAAMAFCASAFIGRTASFHDSFDSPILSSDLLATNTAGFAFSMSGGTAVVTKQSGVSSGYHYISPKFDLRGDFTVTVNIGGIDTLGTGAGGEAGIILWSPDSFADVFYAGSNEIQGDNRIVPGCASGSCFQRVFTNAPVTTFRARRVGSTIFLDYNLGGGFVTLQSATNSNLTIPLTVSLFLIEEHGGSSARSIWFDDFDIVADQFGYGGLLDIRLSHVELCWDTRPGIWYQLQYRSLLTSNSWVPLDGNWLPGSGTRYCTNDSISPTLAQRFYRVSITNSAP